MTENELRRIFPNASRSTLEANIKLSNSIAQPDKKKPLEHSVQGKTSRMERIVLRFEGRRVRPLDPDNFAASVKDCIDGLRHCHLLPNDTIWDIQLETRQTKVKSFAEEKTILDIFYPYL